MARNPDPATDRIELGDHVCDWEDTEDTIRGAFAQLLLDRAVDSQ